MRKLILLGLLFLALASCSKQASAGGGGEPDDGNSAPNQGVSGGPAGGHAGERYFLDNLALASAIAQLPWEQAQTLVNAARENPSFILDLLAVISSDEYLRKLVDKQHALPPGYEPDDLVELLPGRSYRINRQGLMLRRAAGEALEEMAAAAKTAGITLLASSSYRSYAYQEEVYARNVRQSGQEQADRESARPGHSQHQLGLVVDFGSIDDSFADTAAGRWLLVNASRFGWSLSFPNGYEEVTGYRWESWHYRYVGRDLARFIDDYFGGIQQYALQFLLAWEEINQ